MALKSYKWDYNDIYIYITSVTGVTIPFITVSWAISVESLYLILMAIASRDFPSVSPWVFQDVR